MNCPRCNQPLENGASFCGNCGQALTQIGQVMQNQQSANQQAAQPQPPMPANAQPALAAPMGQSVPTYAIGTPAQSKGEMKAVLSVVFGLLGIVGGMVIPLVGFIFCFTGFVLASLAWNTQRRSLSIAGFILSLVALTASVGMTAYIWQQKDNKASMGNSATAKGSMSVTTPCYSAGFGSQLNVDNNENSCDMAAFNKDTFANSTEGYKVYSQNSQTVNEANVAEIGKTAIEKDMQTNLPGYTVVSSEAVRFAGSPGYAVKAEKASDGISVVEAVVFHETEGDKNLFVIVHADSLAKADLAKLEKGWKWK